MSDVTSVKQGISSVIASFGQIKLTHDVVVASRIEIPEADIFVIDNSGDYIALGGETVVTLGRNLGWLAASSLGMKLSFRRPHLTSSSLLNNDVQLSSNFSREC